VATQVTTLAIKRQAQRELATYALAATLVILAAVSTIVLWQYLMPQPVRVTVGRSDVFVARDEPYHLTSANPRADLFVAQVNGEWFALDARTPHTARCKVIWVAARQRLEDPCSGSKFAVNGSYLEGLAWSHLARYPVQVEQDTLSVDISRPLEETESAFTGRCVQAQRQRSSDLEVDSLSEWQPCQHGVCLGLHEYVANFAMTEFCHDLWRNHQRQRPYARLFGS
jgi:nitrite reductase/ring-hydroxylating ferredoxin subunit